MKRGLANPKVTIPVDRMAKVFLVCPSEGVVRAKISRTNCPQGTEIGTLHKYTGRYYLSFEGRNYLRARVIWALHYGEISDDLDIDHIDGDMSNDRIENLREITHAKNIQHAYAMKMAS